tara:strand:+ start:45 stop:221 length:177 start_codon:yes stop_codon:yes gene_type:complete
MYNEKEIKIHPEYDNWLEDCYEAKVNGRDDLVQTFPNYLIRIEAQANLFDRLVAEQNA